MKHWGESYIKSQWSFEKHGDIWNTKEKVRKKKIVIFWKTWRFQNHNGESYIKRRLWSFEKYGDLWNTKEKVRKKEDIDKFKNMEIDEIQGRQL